MSGKTIQSRCPRCNLAVKLDIGDRTVRAWEFSPEIAKPVTVEAIRKKGYKESIQGCRGGGKECLARRFIRENLPNDNTPAEK